MAIIMPMLPCGGPSPINWCEEDYARSSRVAEWWNTITNVSYVIASAGAVRLALRSSTSGYNAKKLQVLFCASLFLTGVFSAYFHATLCWWGQKLDEIFETWTVVCLVYCALGATSRAYSFTSAAFHCLLALAGIVLIPDIFCEVHLAACVGAFIVFMLRCTARVSELGGAGPIKRRLCIGIICGLSGFGAWAIDRIFCDTLRHLSFNPQLHAFAWHPLTALALLTAFDAWLHVDTLLILKRD